MSLRRSFLLWAGGLALFSLFALRFYLAATNKPIWEDEAVGLWPVFNHSLWELFVRGKGEASPSPLPSVFEKIIFDMYQDQPQRWWDLRFFARFLPATYWALACTNLYFWISSRSSRLLGIRFGQNLVLGIGAAFFLHSCAFMNIYAIEDRAYSLWVSLSIFQLLCWIDLMIDDSGKCPWWGFGTFSVLMCLTTYSAFGQVALTVFLLLLSRNNFFWKLPSKLPLSSLIFRSGLVFILSLAVTIKYFLLVPQMNYAPGIFKWRYFFETIFEVIAKTFHHHSAKSLIVTLPLLLLILPLCFRRQYLLFWLVVLNISLPIMGMVFFEGSQWKGGIWASRYVIFLIPSYLALYLAGVLGLAAKIAEATQKRISWITPTLLIVIWSCIQAFTFTVKYCSDIHHDWLKIKERKIFGFSSGCSGTIESTGYSAAPVETLNDACRGIKGP